MKKIFSLLSLTIFASSLAIAETKVKTVICQLQSFSHCADCSKRIPASCENHAFNGSLDVNMKPVKLHWLETNSKTGTEKLVVENNNKTLKELKASKFKRQLVAVEVPASTALYKDQSSTQIAAVMSPAAQNEPSQVMLEAKLAAFSERKKLVVRKDVYENLEIYSRFFRGKHDGKFTSGNGGNRCQC